MARTRQIKPEFFTDEELWELDDLTILLFASLWCIADKAGRLQDNTLLIHGNCLPHRKDAAIDVMLNSLHNREFITRYSRDGRNYIQINNFEKHQNVHPNEKPSKIPQVREKIASRSRKTRDVITSTSTSTSTSLDAAAPPKSLQEEDRQFFNDCVVELKSAIKSWYPKLNEKAIGQMAGMAVNKLNRVVQVHPTALVWMIENKMRIPSDPAEWYSFLNTADKTMHKDGKYPDGTLRPALCHEWASDARKNSPLIPRSEYVSST
jgi:hypothetical protein